MKCQVDWSVRVRAKFRRLGALRGANMAPNNTRHASPWKRTRAGFPFGDAMSVAAVPAAWTRFSHETRIALGERDFALLIAATRKPFKPNTALSQALKAARREVRRA